MIIETFEKIAFEFKNKWALETPERVITYGELNERANRLGHAIMGGYPSDRIREGEETVGLLLDNGMDQVMGILGVLKAGKMYVPLDPSYPRERLLRIISNAGIGLMVSNEATLEMAQELDEKSRKEYNNPGIVIISIDRVVENTGYSSENPVIGEESSETRPAYILYTSGSTGEPKGVRQTCGNVYFYAKSYIDWLGIGPEDRMTYLTAFSHDGAVVDIFSGILSGAVLCPLNIKGEWGMEEIARWMMDKKITIYHSVATVFHYLIQAIKSGMEFPFLKYIVIGGEKFRASDIIPAKSLFRLSRLVHLYGQTESSVNTMGFVGDGDSKEIERIIIGEPVHNVQLLLLNEEGEEVNPLEVGEIFVACPHIAPGYWKNPEATKKAFLNDEELGRLYRSGDLGRLGVDGSIEFVGRKDHQLKIRGFRVELEEIEEILGLHEKVKEGVVKGVEDKWGEIRLCAYIVLKDGINASGETIGISELKEHLGKYLPDYMIPSYFTFLPALPLTASGKMDRKGLPEPDMISEWVYTAPRDGVEEILEGMWSEILDTPKEKIGIDVNFFDLGGHSLKAITLIAQIRKEFKVDISLVNIFKNPYIRGLSEFIRNAEKVHFFELKKVEKRDFYPLSFNQCRIFVLHQLNPGSPAYNMPQRFTLDGEINVPRVEGILKELTLRHESLRTGFKRVDHEPMQYIVESIDLPFLFIDISGMLGKEMEQKREETYRTLVETAFDLDKLPLFRAGLVKLGEKQFELIINMHHIIADGWSQEILKKEFMRLYEGYESGNPVKLDELTFQYKDFACWHNRQLEEMGKEKNGAGEYWKERLKGGISPLQLPVDFPDEAQSPAGAAYRCTLDTDLTGKLLSMAREYRTTLFTVMFTAYLTLLSRLTGQQEVCCSIIVAGRDHAAFQGVMGVFVNSILFNTRIEGDESFASAVKRINEDVLLGFQYLGYPMELVFEELNEKFPRMPVSFNMLNMQDMTSSRRLETFDNEHIERIRDVKFDLEPYLTEYENGISMLWVYRKNLFEPTTIEFMCTQYIALLEYFTGDSRGSLNDFSEEGKKEETVMFARSF